jgi:hypothetical protein
MRYLQSESTKKRFDLDMSPHPMRAFSRAAGIIDHHYPHSRYFWVGEQDQRLNDDIFSWNPEDACFYIGAVMYARKQDRGLLRHNNLGVFLGKEASKVPGKTRKDILDFGSLVGCIIHKALSGETHRYLDAWDWDFHKKQKAESKTHERAREVLEQMIYLDIHTDIMRGLERNMYAL